MRQNSACASEAAGEEGAPVEGWGMPAGAPSLPKPTRDWSNREGAIALKLMIEAFWREKGWLAILEVKSGTGISVLHHARFDVRSDMIGGWPIHKLHPDVKDAA